MSYAKYSNRLTSEKNQTGSARVISEYYSEYLANGQKSKETATFQDKEGKKSTKTAAYTYDSNNNRKEMRIPLSSTKMIRTETSWRQSTAMGFPVTKRTALTSISM